MHPLTQWRSVRPPTLRPPAGRIQVGLVSTAVVVSTTAHAGAAASEPAGGMAWWMAAMAVACLACAAPLVGRRRCTSRAAEHLLGMGVVMILIHLAVLAMPSAGSHHGTAQGAESAHDGAMLALLGVELLCLILASTALRVGRHSLPVHVRTAAQPLPTTHAIS
ncbi:hypothetical protein BJ994_002739 [Arthrobacter pigmenti]|uniref:Uncharacterized protein n=1 Tax=Arthrobacter pigmenti TaxID=271432 RepID=A0A846RKA0_9MICC|nr:hypothetical protein [Arthrobacter pigmenti]NJC23663.1 hypothetical protein [Arthrobacter pigmenti]